MTYAVGSHLAVRPVCSEKEVASLLKKIGVDKDGECLRACPSFSLSLSLSLSFSLSLSPSLSLFFSDPVTPITPPPFSVACLHGG